MKNLHLICNAHIDPVWLWEIEEGIAETLSTFRVAADFCDDYDGFVFCHNESMLYEWVEENDKPLFERIKKLVAEKKWHIMGGWYLQPDCNLCSGESIVRHILEGRYYFREKFGAEPTTAINFDAFGHSRGLVQIMKKAGFDSYIFCRPEPYMIDLPDEDFEWEGFDGSRIACHRAYNSYESHRGEADEKIKGWIEANEEREVGVVLWGIGNHGGGPSRVDYEKIKALDESNGVFKLIHSTPEAYFAELAEKRGALPVYKGLMNPRYTGCYTTQMRTKALHRRLENELYLTEKLAAHAYTAGVMDYPAEEIRSATKDLMMVEFHDIIPGSAIEPVEEYSAHKAGHGLSILKDIKIKAFLALCSGEKKAEDGTIPVFVYNPHPFEVDYTAEVEYQLPDQNKNPALFALPEVYENGKLIPSQCEHEISNFNVDWRKKSVFSARLAPGTMSRFDVRIRLIDTPAPLCQPYNYSSVPDGCISRTGDTLVFDNGDMSLSISLLTGLAESYKTGGNEYLSGESLCPIAVYDDENSWAHKEKSFRQIKGEFRLVSPERSAALSGIIADEIPPAVRIIENGDIRTVVEAIFGYGSSYIVRRYILPKKGSAFRVSERVCWNEIMTMLKLSVKTNLKDGFIGQTAYGSENLLTNGDEMVSQKWNIVTGDKGALSIINSSTYGSDCKDGELRVTLLRSPGYSAGKSDFSVRKKYIMEQDRYSPFIDQGIHDYMFEINAGDRDERLAHAERESQVFSEKLVSLSFYPTGAGKHGIAPFAELSDDAVILSVFKKAQTGERYIIRLFNPTDKPRATSLTLPTAGITFETKLGKYEIKTFEADPVTHTAKETGITEK